MKTIDWTRLFEKYKGLWVALKPDEITVISSGKDLKSVYEQALNRGHKAPIIYHVPTKITASIG